MDADTQTHSTMTVVPSSKIPGPGAGRPKKQMTLADTERYHQLVDVIEQSLEVFVHVYEALREIRDEELWRAEFTSWKDFVAAKFNFTGKHGQKILQLGDYLKRANIEGMPKPTINQAAELKRLGDPLKAHRIWKDAQKRASNSGRAKPNLEDVAALVDNELDRNKGATTQDWAGNSVEGDLAKVFSTSRIMTDTAAELKQIRKRLLALHGVPGSELMSPGALSQAFGSLEVIMNAMIPHSMCLNPNCASTSGGCAACHGHGWVNKRDWQEQVKALKSF